jgi:hypothetical protein
MAALAALGFSLHTGWGVVVAVAEVDRKFKVLLRRRVELLPPGDSVPRFVYHKAAELSPSQASELVERAGTASREAARIAVKDVLDHLQSPVFTIETAGLSGSSKPVPKDLSAVLRSHPMIHTAEAALFRQVIVSACGRSGLKVISAPQREVWLNAASVWGIKEAAFRKQVDGLRKSVGAPWNSDHKAATAFALLALRQGR